MKTKEQVKEFVKELKELSIKHDIYIGENEDGRIILYDDPHDKDNVVASSLVFSCGHYEYCSQGEWFFENKSIVLKTDKKE